MAGKLPSVLMRAGEDRRVRAGHPWAFSNEILMDPETKALPAGSLVILRAPQGKASAMVAAYIGAAYWFTASTSFANPAAAFGRMFSNSFAGIAPSSVIVGVSNG